MNTLVINRSSLFSIDQMFQTIFSKSKSFYVFFVFVISKCNAFVMIVVLLKQDWTLFLNYIKSMCSTLQTPMNVHHVKYCIKLTSVKNKLRHHVTCITFDKDKCNKLYKPSIVLSPMIYMTHMLSMWIQKFYIWVCFGTMSVDSCVHGYSWFSWIHVFYVP